MSDSLFRIKQEPKEVWAIKLADRITNLQQPPNHWDSDKIDNYKVQAKQILDYLKGGNEYLELRLKNKISEYENIAARFKGTACHARFPTYSFPRFRTNPLVWNF